MGEGAYANLLSRQEESKIAEFSKGFCWLVSVVVTLIFDTESNRIPLTEGSRPRRGTCVRGEQNY